MPMIVGNSDGITVPNVRNLPLPEALRRLESEGFSAVVSGKQFSKEVPENHVLIQQPFPYSYVKQTRRVYLTVSKGNTKTEMPNLFGKSLRDARVLLLRAGFELGEVSYLHDSIAPANTIMQQSITAGKPMNVDAKVDVVISLGLEKTLLLVPDLIGLSLAEAEQVLRDYGLTPGTVHYERDGTFAPNTVFSQIPDAGSEIEAGATVEIFISK